MLLHRQTHANQATYYRSPLLGEAGIPHAFSTRLGGVSQGPFASLNLGNPSGVAQQDSEANLHENYRRLHEAIGCPQRPRCYVHQSHGGDVVLVESGRPHDGRQRADAMVTSDPARLLSVRYADCVPVLVATADGRTVAAVHAGWRGVIARILPAAIAQMESPPGRLIVAIGPCIGRDRFEIGPDVAAQFKSAFGPRAPLLPHRDGKSLADLAAALRLQLSDLGIPEDRIDLTDRCTFRDADEFFSHRRDHGVTGRMAALIGPRA